MDIRKQIYEFIEMYVDTPEPKKLCSSIQDLVEELAEIKVKNIEVTPCCEELPIYMTYDNSDSEVFAAFTDRERCMREVEECGVPMQETILYFGKRK